MPVKHHVGGDVAVPDAVARRQELSLFSEVDPEERKWFVSGSAVDHCSSDDVFRLARANRGAESLDLAKDVGVLPQSLFAERPKEE